MSVQGELESMEERGTGPDSCFNTVILADLWQIDCKRMRVAPKKGESGYQNRTRDRE